jgi:bifunctional UDP-N-acetylglucosamine pyrophosphorylase/glucosamine-1-phosphate N-acetyltransferase
MRDRINERWMKRGVTMWDPSQTYIDADVELAQEVSLLPGTVLKGKCEVARGAQIGPHANLNNVVVGENAHVGTVDAQDAKIGSDATVSSFVVLGSGTEILSGEFVAPFEHRNR